MVKVYHAKEKLEASSQKIGMLNAMSERVMIAERGRVRGAMDGRRRSWGLAAGIGAALLLSFLVQMTTYRVADWGQFAFYDPGTVLKGDMLLAKGCVPTVDFGYTHGLLSLLYGRVGFGVLGRTPWSFLGLTLLAEMGMAWGLARILRALEIGKRGMAVFWVGLPMAIFPAYLTLTHVLEGMLILLALAEQAEGKRGRALALMTVCLFVKPSMAYVYGLVLVVLILGEAGSQKPEARSWKGILRGLLPAAAAGVVVFGGLTMWVGWRVVVSTLLPMTGARTYAASGFGFFAEQGRAFWMPGEWWRYVVTPVGVFLLGTLVCAVGVVWGGGLLARGMRTRGTLEGATDEHAQRGPFPAGHGTRDTRIELLVTLGILELVFLLGFYGWTGSWTYYSYLVVLAMVVAVEVWRVSWKVVGVVVGLLVLSHGELGGAVWNDWTTKERMPGAGGLWVYSYEGKAWRNVVEELRGKGKVVVMTNGWIGGREMPGNFELPDAWFPEPGIPTASEVERVKKQVAEAEYVVLWWQYGKFDLWNSEAFAEERSEFVGDGVLDQRHPLEILRRR